MYYSQNIIEKIIKAYLVSKNYSAEIGNVIYKFDTYGAYTGIKCEVDLSLDSLISYAESYCVDDENTLESIKNKLNFIKTKRNGPFNIDHLRFTTFIEDGVEYDSELFGSISHCEYNSDRLRHVTNVGGYGKEFFALVKYLDPFFSYVEAELQKLMGDVLSLAHDVVKKISQGYYEFIRTFEYRDSTKRYSVTISSKGLPCEILEELIAPDKLLHDLSGCRQILKNTRRYLNGYLRCNYVSMLLGNGRHTIFASKEQWLMSEREMNARDDVKSFRRVFYKVCSEFVFDESKPSPLYPEI